MLTDLSKSTAYDKSAGTSPEGDPGCATAAPKISIITPNYNYAGFLEAAMRSVLDQRYPNLEYIVMDGGSTDGSIDIIRRHEKNLARWETRPKCGQYADISAGFAGSTGEIMGWLNSDDMQLPWTLRAVGEIFETFPQVEWISTLKPGSWDWAGFCLGFSSLNGFAREAFMDGRYLPPEVSNTNLPQLGYIQQESTFWRRSLWEKAGGFVSQDFGMAGDFELWNRFYRHAELYGVGIPLAGFRLQDRQQTTQIAKYVELCGSVLKAERKASGWRPSVLRSLAHQVHGRFTKRLFERFEYLGWCIARKNVSDSSAGWDAQRYRFI